MNNERLPKTEWWHLTDEDFIHLDVPTVIEQHTSTRLNHHRTQIDGACPFDDCSGDDNGFVVWAELALSKKKRHYWCRNCRRSGNVVKLLQDIKGLDFVSIPQSG